MAQQRIIPSGANQGKASATTKREPRKSAKTVKSGNVMTQFAEMIQNALTLMMKKQANKYRKGWSRYQRHQGEQEKARRIRQIAKGMIYCKP